MAKIHKLIIIGGANAGYTAALYAARARLEPLVFVGKEPGGQLMLTSVIENFPGFPEGIDGAELMLNMRKQAERFGSIIKDTAVVSVDFQKRPFTVRTEDEEFKGDSVIIATGASAKWLGVKGEQELIGRGVSACATCDAAFFRDKEVAVVGGGDAAMEDVLALTKFATKITIIHRRDSLRASKIMQERVLKHPKISVMWDSVVEEVIGDTVVTGIKVKNIKTNEIKDLLIGGLFVAIGHKPNTEFLAGQIELDVKNYIVVKNHTETSVKGVFAAGDVADYRYRQAITAAASGCQAAIDAEKYLEHQDI